MLVLHDVINTERCERRTLWEIEERDDYYQTLLKSENKLFVFSSLSLGKCDFNINADKFSPAL